MAAAKTVTLEGRYRWGDDHYLWSRERGVREGDVRVIDDRLFYATYVFGFNIFLLSRKVWWTPVPSEIMAAIVARPESLRYVPKIIKGD